MNGLDRQPGKKFHIWAKCIQEHLQFYECDNFSYPKSIISVKVYIDIIREFKSKPNLRRCSFCRELYNKEYNHETYLKNMHMHYLICSSTYFYSRHTQKATAIQAVF